MKKAKDKQSQPAHGRTAKLASPNTECYTSNVTTAQPQRLWVYKNKTFARFQKNARISDADVWEAAKDASDGKLDADLGGGVVKQRIAREGQGKSGGSRAIVLFRKGTRVVFAYGFEKKDLANIKKDELEAFRKLADLILAYTDEQIAAALKAGELIEVPAPKEKTSATKVPEQHHGSDS